MKTNMLEYLETTALRVPERIAFYDDAENLSFESLLEKAQRIGSCLAENTGPRKPVALLLDARSISNIPAMFGVLYAGCVYAPLDITMPPERLKLLLDLLQPSAVLADERGAEAFESCCMEGGRLLSYSDAISCSVNREKISAIRRQASPYDPLSILYTSGSTGIPKGSIQTHFSYLHWLEATICIYDLTEDAVFGNQSPFFYANSILDIFPTVALGAKTYLLPSGVLTFPKRLIDCLNKRQVTEICMTPSSFINVVSASVLAPGCLPGLKRAYMSGESMPWQPLKVWMDASPNASWWHFYGSTEMFSVAVGKVDTVYQDSDRLPVGKPFPLAHILFVDESGSEVNPGEPGEMLLSSPWIASGYHRDAQRTAASWVVDPLSRGWYERFYRSGDIGYMREDGQLMVLGRRDTQIKHLGYRMEIGEVEAALRRITGWKEGCVLFDSAKDKLWCFYTGELTEKQIAAGLKERLSRYMLPDVYVHLEEMPYTATMKLDRSKLRKMIE